MTVGEISPLQIFISLVGEAFRLPFFTHENPFAFGTPGRRPLPVGV